MAQVVEHMFNKHKLFKHQYCTPHQKKSRDKLYIYVDTDVFIILKPSYF
jgi:hypothetical protein